MLHHASILLFTLAVLAILSFSDRGTARASQPDVIVITDGCYTIASQRTCPPEFSGYVPTGPDDVFLIDPFGTIMGPGQQQQQQQQQQPMQQVEPGKGSPQQQTGGGLIVKP